MLSGTHNPSIIDPLKSTKYFRKMYQKKNQISPKYSIRVRHVTSPEVTLSMPMEIMKDEIGKGEK